MTRLEPKKGAIAICSRGCLGLITKDKPKKITYKDGNHGVAYIGIHIEEGEKTTIGSPWSSRSPRVICHVEDLHLSGKFDEFLVKARFYTAGDCCGESYVVVGDNSGELSQLEQNGATVRLIPINKQEGEKNV